MAPSVILWLLNIAMESNPFVDDFAAIPMAVFHGYVKYFHFHPLRCSTSKGLARCRVPLFPPLGASINTCETWDHLGLSCQYFDMHFYRLHIDWWTEGQGIPTYSGYKSGQTGRIHQPENNHHSHRVDGMSWHLWGWCYPNMDKSTVNQSLLSIWGVL